ncbi:hypothetical protein [Micromonospora musae]|uniref:hypothetical protein n=1 Tax=Micromonospora musae TaxID=1894970 RepID=UPI0033EDA919
MRAASGGGTEDIDQARRSAHGLGLFIRSLVGLDREAATEVFGEFLVGRANLEQDQIGNPVHLNEAEDGPEGCRRGRELRDELRTLNAH